MKYAEIVYETFCTMFKNRQRYYRHIVSVVLSIAAVIVLQCMSRNIIPLLFSSDEKNSGFSLVVFRCESADGSAGAAVISEPELTAGISGVCECYPVLSEQLCNGVVSDINESACIEAVSDGFWMNCSLDMKCGSPLTDLRWQTGNAAVISDKTSVLLFNDSDACGQKIRIYTSEYGVTEFVVCGVYISDTISGSQESENIYVSCRFMDLYSNDESRLYEEITYVAAGKPDRDGISQSLVPLNLALTDRSFRITAEYSEDNEDPASGFVSLLMDVLLVFAVLAFFLSNIGIMNMTFIMTGRRTREIGIRKAVGGHTGDIRFQIITESCITAMAGSILGIIGGLLAGNLILFAAEEFAMHGEVPLSFCVPLESIFLSTAGTFILSTVLSLFPADKASRMTVTDAVRSRE